ncbi:MAG: C40 family peptidase [Rhodocyclaceae bacterium]
MSIFRTTIRRLAMPPRHYYVPLIAAVVLAFGTTAPVQADEENRRNEDSTFLERYTNKAQDLILKGLEMVGVRYSRGGTDPDAGLDCSGFVQLVFRDAIGFGLPRTSREMSEVGDRVDRQELKPGDLVFFNTMRRAFSHVGIYLGEGRFLHSPRPGGEVRVEDMGSSYWVKRYNGARRVVER